MRGWRNAIGVRMRKTPEAVSRVGDSIGFGGKNCYCSCTVLTEAVMDEVDIAIQGTGNGAGQV